MGNSALPGITELQWITFVISQRSKTLNTQVTLGGRMTCGAWDRSRRTNTVRANRNTSHPGYSEMLRHILLINKTNLIDWFAYLPHVVASQATQNQERPFGLLQTKGTRKPKQGKQNPPKLTQSRCTTRSQSVTHPKLKARTNMKNKKLQSLISSEHSLTKQWWELSWMSN